MNILFNRRQLCMAGLGCSSLVLLGCDQGGEKQTAEKIEFSEQELAFSIGSKDAPVIMQEFFSLTCPHCANFHRTALPELKKNYVDTGKILMLYRDFPLDGIALRGHMLARSMSPKLGIKFYEVLLAQQSKWALSSGDIEPLKGLARLAGLSPDQIDEAINNEALLDQLVADRQRFTSEYGISGTPSFTIGHERFSGGSFSDLGSWIDNYLT